ncbi:MAG TPA: hypothetical protein VFB33_10230 [Candidatus Binataceae bacterium]|jgi:hypothetical protein|nr:hypothetical protein [Candidatus Binataceae bacterium]
MNKPTGLRGMAALAAAACAGAAYLALASAAAATLGAALDGAPSSAAARRALAPSAVLAQNDQDVSSADIEKYVAVYRAMQHNHSLDVEQAAAAQGLKLHAFRELEERIERNDAAREQARRELAHGAERSEPSTHGSGTAPQP